MSFSLNRTSPPPGETWLAAVRRGRLDPLRRQRLRRPGERVDRGVDRDRVVDVALRVDDVECVGRRGVPARLIDRPEPDAEPFLADGRRGRRDPHQELLVVWGVGVQLARALNLVGDRAGVDVLAFVVGRGRMRDLAAGGEADRGDRGTGKDREPADTRRPAGGRGEGTGTHSPRNSIRRILSERQRSGGVRGRDRPRESSAADASPCSPDASSTRARRRTPTAGRTTSRALSRTCTRPS